MNDKQNQWSKVECASIEEFASQFPPSFHDDNMRRSLAFTIALFMELSPVSTPEMVDLGFSEYSSEYKAYCFDLYSRWKEDGYPWIGKHVDSLTDTQLIAHAFGAIQAVLKD